MKNKKLLIGSCAVLAVLLIAMVSVMFFFTPGTQAGWKNITVTVQHLDGTAKDFRISTDAEYLRGALEQESLIQGTEQEYGLWVETVDGETADPSLEQWWRFDLNGEIALYSVDSQPVSDGDKIFFAIQEGYDAF